MRLLGRSSLVFCLVLAVWYTFPGDFAFASKDKKEECIVLTYQSGYSYKGSVYSYKRQQYVDRLQAWMKWDPKKQIVIRYKDCLDDERRFKRLSCYDMSCSKLVVRTVNDVERDGSDEDLVYNLYFAAVRKRKGLLSVAKPLKVIPLTEVITGKRTAPKQGCVLGVDGAGYNLQFGLSALFTHIDIYKMETHTKVNTARLFLNAKMIREVPADEPNGEVPTDEAAGAKMIREVPADEPNGEVPTDEAA